MASSKQGVRGFDRQRMKRPHLLSVQDQESGVSRLDVSAGQLDQIRLGRIRRNHAVEAVTVVAEDRVDVRHQVDAAPQLIFQQTG